MHRSRIVATIAAAVAALALVAAQSPADEEVTEETSDCRLVRGEDTPDDTSDDVSVCRVDAWFHASDARLGNVDGSPATFDENEPEATGGGGTFITQGLGTGEQRATFEGTFEGPIDNVAVTLYSIAPTRRTYDRIGLGDWSFDLTLSVDSVPIYQTTNADGDEVSTEHRDNGVSVSHFAIEDLYTTFEEFADFLPPEGTHTVQLEVRAHYTDGDNGVLVYDTAQTPSGMVFNIEETEIGGEFTRLNN